MNAIVVVDGAQIEVADELSATVIKKHIANLSAQLSDTKADAAKAKADKEEADEEDERMQKDAKLKLDAAAGEIVALKQQLADAQALNSPEKLDALVKDRLAVTDSAMKLLPNTFSFDGKSVADIRKAAVSAKLGDATKDMSDAAIEGAFKALTVAAANSGTARLADSISRSHQNGGGGQVDVRDAALAEREAYLKDAWRTPAKQ